ncbi:MAG: TonB-dependent receptor family protein, partial [Dinghuibacter sp.]|nr:TonB-dependent receptor family protein [Dinghuibacter sp.]
AGGNINYRKGKVNLFGNYNYGKRRTAEQLDLFREVKNGSSVTQFEQYAFSPTKRQSHTAKLGVDVQLGKNTSFGVVADGLLASNKDINNYSRTKIGSGASVVDSSIEVTTNKITDTRSGSVSLNFRHRFGAKGGELSFDADRSFFKRDGDEYLDNFYYLQFDKTQPHKAPLFLRNHAISEIGITVAKLDYSVSLGEKNGKLEAGLKHSRVKGDNDLRFDSLSSGNWVKDPSKTNHFLYDEMVNAAYINYSGQFKKWEVTTGLRAEQTISEGNSITLSNVVKRNYLQFFPSVFLSYAHSDNHQFSMAYSRRVQRPNYEKLNPFIFFLDQYTYQQGNPYLQPSVSDNMELSYTWKQFLTTTLGWQRIADPSITVTEQDDNTKVTYAIDRNLNTQHAYSFGVNAGLPVTQWWNTQNNAQAFYLGFKYQDANNNLNAGRLAFQFNSSNNFTLGKGWTAELNGSYQSPLQYGIFKLKPQWEIGAGVKKEIMKKRASIRLSVDDFFNTSIGRISTNYQNMNIRFIENSYNTIARLTFTMKFGKQDAQNRRRNAAAAEEKSRLNTGGSR